MTRFAVLSLAFTLVLSTVPTVAQAQGAAGTVAQVITVDPLPGHARALEEGVMKHMEWSVDNGGTWQWNGFEVIMGERTGQYVWGSFNHTYADFDSPDVDPAANAESIDRNIAPHVMDVTVGLMNLRTDLSMLQADRPLRPLYEVVTFNLHMGAELQFGHALAGLKEALASVPDMEYFVYQAAQGGNGQWVVSIPHESFASMGGLDGEGFATLLRGAHGEYGAQALQEQLNSAVVSMSSEIFALRPDLSVNQPM